MEWFEISDIIRGVIEITKDSLVKWKSFDNEGFKIFYLEIGTGRVTITRQYESMDDEYDYIMELRNKAGDVIENFYTGYEDRGNQFILQELYDVAENSYLQRQATLNSMRDAIAKLKSGDVF